MAEEIFEQLEVASWKPDGVTAMYFPVESIRESGGNRLVVRERPYRDGAKVDDTGSLPKRWAITCLIVNDLDEPGLERNDRPLYPEVLDALIASFDVHETGDLTLPTKGRIRARADTYEREEKADERSGARLTLNFVADNEDDVDASSFTLPSVNASARRLAEVTVFSAQANAAWNDDLGGDGEPGQSLNDFLGQLEDLANTPDAAASELSDRASSVRETAARAERLLTDRAHPAHEVNRAPELARTLIRLRRVQDMAGQAEAARSRSRPSVISITIDRPRTLASVAVELKQPYEGLLEINLGRVADPLALEDGDVIRVFG